MVEPTATNRSPSRMAIVAGNLFEDSSKLLPEVSQYRQSSCSFSEREKMLCCFKASSQEPMFGISGDIVY